MWVVIPYHNGDIRQAQDLINWGYQLDKCPIDHACLLVSDAAVSWNDALKLQQSASRVFRRVEIASNEISVEGWPFGANSLFKVAAQFMEQRKITPWFWMEPDCIPLKPGWADQLEAAYKKLASPIFKFVGSVMTAKEPNMPKEYLAGCAMYPAEAWTRMAPVWKEDVAFDICTYAATITASANTNLIQHFWGKKDLAPTFAENKTAESPVNTFTRENLHPEAVVFHRNKDGTLIRILRKMLGLYSTELSESSLSVVFPFCWMDAQLMLYHFQWLHKLHNRINRRAVIHYDNTVSPGNASHVVAIAKMVFEDVQISRYPNSPRTGWPTACNWSFQHAAKFMAANSDKAWFWHEADCVALKPDWLYQLEQEYKSGGRPFGGTIINAWDGLPGGHMNGVAVYPPNVGEYSRKAMTTVGQAWDTAMHDELGTAKMHSLCHKMNHLIQHCGAVQGGKCRPANGPLPDFGSQRDVDLLIEPSSVIFHPSKNPNLSIRLAERLQ